MKRDDFEKLIGGYATGTLSDAERSALFSAALEDQRLFDALADEEALRDLLEDERARGRLLEVLGPAKAPSSPFAWLQRPFTWAAAGTVAATAVFIAVIGVRGLQQPTPQQAAIQRSVGAPSQSVLPPEAASQKARSGAAETSSRAASRPNPSSQPGVREAPVGLAAPEMRAKKDNPRPEEKALADEARPAIVQSAPPPPPAAPRAIAEKIELSVAPPVTARDAEADSAKSARTQPPRFSASDTALVAAAGTPGAATLFRQSAAAEQEIARPQTARMDRTRQTGAVGGVVGGIAGYRPGPQAQQNAPFTAGLGIRYLVAAEPQQHIEIEVNRPGFLYAYGVTRQGKYERLPLEPAVRNGQIASVITPQGAFVSAVLVFSSAPDTTLATAADARLPIEGLKIASLGAQSRRERTESSTFVVVTQGESALVVDVPLGTR